ncbi:MAG: hypothetical protein ACNA7T_15015, partial [Haliea sp.]
MKKLSGIAAGFALAALISQPLVAGAASPVAEDEAWVNSAFGGASSMPSGVEMLSGAEMEDATGRLAPLFLTFAIAGFDVALMGLYWGVYVPHYSGGGC